MFNMGSKMEAELIRENQTKAFENLYIYLTNECNMFCKHCYLGNRLIEREIMPLEMALNHLKFWYSHGARKVSFLGGEPTFYSELFKCVEFAHELGYEKVIINTNLSQYAYNVIEKFSQNTFSYIQTSLDGSCADTHDFIRGKGNYSQTTKAIAKLAKERRDLRIIMTVNQINKEEVCEMIKVAENLGATLIKFHIMSEIGNAKKEFNMGISPYEWIEICDKIKQYKKENIVKIKISYQPSYIFKNRIDEKEFSQYPGCLGKQKNRISVFSDGKCYICSFLFDINQSYATLNENIIEVNEGTLDNNFDNIRCKTCNQKCETESCIAENELYHTDLCTKYSDIFPICRLWKVEL